MACSFCSVSVYIKVKRYTAPMMAPMTREQELRDELMNLTGEDYVKLVNNFCPMCGERLTIYSNKEINNA